MKQATLALASLLALGVSSGADQDKEATDTQADDTRCGWFVTISRYRRREEDGGLPYTLAVDRTIHVGVKLRMGVEVPVPVTIVRRFTRVGLGPSPQTSFQYRNVGTNIDCSADSLDDGRFRVHPRRRAVVDPDRRRRAKAGPSLLDRPMFRTLQCPRAP